MFEGVKALVCNSTVEEDNLCLLGIIKTRLEKIIENRVSLLVCRNTLVRRERTSGVSRRTTQDIRLILKF